MHHSRNSEINFFRNIIILYVRVIKCVIIWQNSTFDPVVDQIKYNIDFSSGYILKQSSLTNKIFSADIEKFKKLKKEKNKYLLGWVENSYFFRSI